MSTPLYYSKNKNSNKKDKNRERKIILWTLLPIALIIIALVIFLACWFGCKPKNPPKPSPPQDSLVITQESIKEKPDYIVPRGTKIYYSLDADDGYVQLDHNDFNALAYSKDHNDVTNFTIEGPIDFGFMVDPTMNFQLTGEAESLMDIHANNGVACGLVVCRKEVNDGIYEKNMLISKSLTVKISAKESIGILFNSMTGLASINGTYAISSSDGQSYGVKFYSNVGGNTIIYGVWNISTQSSDDSYGIAFCAEQLSASVQAIYGTFTISSTNGGSAFGIYFYTAKPGSTQIVDGTFTINSTGNAVGVRFWSSMSYGSTQIINGVWSIITASSYPTDAFYCQDGDSYGSLIINGVFTIINTSTGNIHSVDFYKNQSVLRSLDMSSNTTSFFSNKKDSSNVFDKIANWQGSYKWNGASVAKNGQSGNTSQADSALKIEAVKDNTILSNFSVIGIKECGTSYQNNKKTFNDAYQQALDAYVKGNCPILAKLWLEEIIYNLSQI